MSTHQYQVTDGDGSIRNSGNTSSTTFNMLSSTGHVEDNDSTNNATYTVNELIIDYTDTSAFTLTITGASPSVGSHTLTLLSGSAVTASWSINAVGSLVMSFNGASEYGSESLWEFGSTAPPLHLKVRVKRQTP